MFIQKGSSTEKRLYLGEEIAEALTRYCQNEGFLSVVSVSDSNTYSILGHGINQELKARGIRVKTVILDGQDLVAAERAIVSVLVEIDRKVQLLIAIGSGTITDIVRFVSHRVNKAFVSVPTAPSVDGYAADSASIYVQGYKRTVPCHAPSAIFASLPVLSAAPPAMIAAGYQEVLGKSVALADWELSHLLLGREYSSDVSATARAAYQAVVNATEGIARREPESIRVLFSALLASGAVTGSEYQIAYILEMCRSVARQKSVLYGTQIAAGAVIAAGWYHRLRQWNRDEIAGRSLEVPDYEDEAQEIRTVLGDAGSQMIERNGFLSTLNQPQVERIRTHLLDQWERVQEIAASVPAPEELERQITTVTEAGQRWQGALEEEEMHRAARLSYFVDDRFTIATLRFVLGI